MELLPSYPLHPYFVVAGIDFSVSPIEILDPYRRFNAVHVVGRPHVRWDDYLISFSVSSEFEVEHWLETPVHCPSLLRDLEDAYVVHCNN